MAQARVKSLDLLLEFRAALIKFADTASSGLIDAESEMQRVLEWLKQDRVPHWKKQVARLTEKVAEARNKVVAKKAQKGVDGTASRADDEEREYKKWLRKLEEAEEKAAATRRWINKLDREMQQFKGRMQQLATDLETDIPRAVTELDRMSNALGIYMATAAPTVGKDMETAGAGSASRGGDTGEQQDPEAVALLLRGHGLSASTRAELDPETAPVRKGFNTPIDVAAVNLVRDLIEPEAGARVLVPEPPADDAIITLSRDVFDANRIYMERQDSSASDSGWFIGFADPEIAPSRDDCMTVKLSDFIETWAEFVPLLSLPTGSLILIQFSEVKALLDHNDKNVWADVEKKLARERSEAESKSEVES